jgi:hypothetical protein
MTAPDRLAKVTEYWQRTQRRQEDGRAAYLPDDVIDDSLWLIGEVERLREQAELARELGDLLPRKELTITRLRGLLARLEWAGTAIFDEWYKTGPACPACAAERDDGHFDDCWLAEALGRG